MNSRKDLALTRMNGLGPGGWWIWERSSWSTGSGSPTEETVAVSRSNFFLPNVVFSGQPSISGCFTCVSFLVSGNTCNSNERNVTKFLP